MRKRGLIGICAVWAVLVVLPVGGLLLEAFRAGFPEESTFGLLVSSVLLGVTVSLPATLIGTLVGLILAKAALPYKGLFKLLLLLPLLLPPYIFTVAWVDFLLAVGLPALQVYGTPTAVLVLILVLSPVSMLVVESALERISPNLEAAALLAGPYALVLRRIVLPLIRPAILSSLLLTFVLAVSEFTVPAFLSVRVLTTEIFTQFSAFYDFPAAISQAAWLVMLCGAGLWLESRYLARQPFTAVSLKDNHARFVPLARNTNRLAGIVTCYVVLTAFLPLGAMLAQALSRGPENLFTAFSLLQTEMLTSFQLAFAGAILISLFGLALTYLKNRTSARVLDFTLLLTFALPSIVAGLALIRFYNTPYLNFIYATPLILLLAWLMRYLWVGERMLHNRYMQLPVAFEQAAALSGARDWTTFRVIVLPLLADAWFGAFMVSFIFCIGELGTAIMVYPPGTSLLPIKIFTLMANAPQGLTSALCLATLLFTSLVLAGWLGVWSVIRKAIPGYEQS